MGEARRKVSDPQPLLEEQGNLRRALNGRGRWGTAALWRRKRSPQHRLRNADSFRT